MFNIKIIYYILYVFLNGIEICQIQWNLIRIFYMTPLIHASWAGNVELVKLLIKQKGIDINCKDI